MFTHVTPFFCLFLGGIDGSTEGSCSGSSGSSDGSIDWNGVNSPSKKNVFCNKFISFSDPAPKHTQRHIVSSKVSHSRHDVVIVYMFTYVHIPPFPSPWPAILGTFFQCCVQSTLHQQCELMAPRELQWQFRIR